MVWGLDPDNEGKVLWQYQGRQGQRARRHRVGIGGRRHERLHSGLRRARRAERSRAASSRSSSRPASACGTRRRRSSNATRGRGCTGAQSAPVSVIPGVVFSGSVDGHMRAYSTDGRHDPLGLQHGARVRDREPRAGEGRLDRRGRPGDRRRPARHQLGLRAVARAAGQRAAGVFGKVAMRRSRRAAHGRDRERRPIARSGGTWSSTGCRRLRGRTDLRRVRPLLQRAADGRDLDALLLPELLDDDVDWSLRDPPEALHPSAGRRADSSSSPSAACCCR